MAETFTSGTGGQDDDAPFRSRLTFDLDVDICIVGAGLAGLTTALEAARLGASVAVLEGRHIGWNASGHQLGTVMPGYGLPIGELIERVGLEDARELWALSKEGADYVRAAATEEAMPGIGLTEGALEVSNVDAGDTLISRLQVLSEDFETEVEGWQIDRVRAQLGTARYFHGIYYPKAFQVDGRKYIHGLAEQARRAGARIFEPDPLDQLADRKTVARHDGTQLIAGRVPADVAALEHGDAGAKPRGLQRHSEAGKPGPDHANIDIEVERKPRTKRCVLDRAAGATCESFRHGVFLRTAAALVTLSGA